MHPTASNLRVALYVRVSSGQPAEAKAIAQQLAELRHRIAKDGGSFDDGHCYIDRGVPGASLQRPALQRLRDQAARGSLDRLYVLAPDRLGRTSTALAQVMNEFAQAGVELTFLDPTGSA
jgi:site-specific DNA recombinase